MNKACITRYLTVCLLLALLTSCGGNKGSGQSGKGESAGTESTQDSGKDGAESVPSVEAGPDQEFAVIVSAAPSETEITAADMLAKYLSALLGKDCPRIDENSPFDGYGFYVGKTAAFDTSEADGKSDGSYYLTPFDKGLAIYGAGPRGTIYGVCGYLTDFCGYRFFSVYTGMGSGADTIRLPEEKVRYDSYFEFTDTDWRSPWDPVYSMVNGLNSGTHRNLTSAQGGDIDYLGPFCHTFTTEFCSADRYFDSHPEYFALHDGRRVPDQLCLTNVDVYDIVREEVFQLLEEKRDPNAVLQIVSLSQADNQSFCECEKCSALDKENGSHSGSILSFVNRIAKEVKEKGYDNIAIDTFAYKYSRKAPKNIVPEENVIVRYCTIEGCYNHSMDDPECPQNAALAEDLREWCAVCDRMYIWDYATNYSYTIGIFPDFGVLQKNIQYFYEMGVKGVFEEGNYYIDQCDTEFGELRAYLIARLLRNPYCDMDEEMRMFCDSYYGNGGQYVKAAIEAINDREKDGYITIYHKMSDTFSISQEEADEIDAYWELAEKACEGTGALKAVVRSELSWRYVKAMLHLSEFSGTKEARRAEKEKLYNDLVAHGVTKFNEWEPLTEKMIDFEEMEQVD